MRCLGFGARCFGTFARSLGTCASCSKRVGKSTTGRCSRILTRILRDAKRGG